jgi:type I restriction enzyme M protein
MKTIIANPPFSAIWNADDSDLQDKRFCEYGKLAPKSKADFAFIQDMIYRLDEEGIMAVVLPHGVLFRGSAEGHIRRYLIEKKNCIDAVIGLPVNIFYGTTIPTCVLIFKKNRKEDDGILFIDSSKEFEKAKNKNLLTDENINKISDTYHNREVIEKYSCLVSLKEVEENDYNLNIPRYVDTFEDKPEIDIHAIMNEIEQLEAKRADLDRQIGVYLKELKIK